MAKASKKETKDILKAARNLFIPAVTAVILLILVFVSFELAIQDKFLPQTFIGDTNVGFLTKAQATQILSDKFQKRSQQKLLLNNTFTLDLATSSARIDYSVIDSSFSQGHSELWPQKILTQLKMLIFKSKNTPDISINLNPQIEPIAKSVYQAPVNAQIIFNETVTEEGTPSANIQIKESREGTELDKKALERDVVNFLTTGNFSNQLPLTNITPKITTDHVKRAKEALESSKNEPVILKYNSDSWTIDTKQLLAILDLTSGGNLLLDKNKAMAFLEDIASQIDQPVLEGQFNFNPDTKRVVAFQPSQEGKKLDIDKTYILLTQVYNGTGSKTIALSVDIVKPKILTADVNNLGIKELLGQGISNFAGSIPNRIYNVSLTASKINGVLIAPGEIFSFNQTVGDITAATGFRQAYVIREGRTVLDDGGGVCQDSTTLFRAVLNAGLPVIQRTAHAYRVGYYEQGFPPGLDATVYYPSVDFQFKNDTGHHILIQSYTSGLTLYVNLYGTSDGRISRLTTPVIKNQTPPPPDLRQDDPTLPKGTVKQVDWSAWGANVSFTRTVTRGGETLAKETWYSNYKPWQAVFLVGTQ